jgi:Glycine-zipper domain
MHLKLTMGVSMKMNNPLVAAIAIGLAFLVFSVPRFAAAQSSARLEYAQNYPPPGYYPPPCAAVTPGPFRGAARGAAGGAIFGAIAGNAGKGAAIGAGIGMVGGAARRASARSTGSCY